jgi:hypothetical protein
MELARKITPSDERLEILILEMDIGAHTLLEVFGLSLTFGKRKTNFKM